MSEPNKLIEETFKEAGFLTAIEGEFSNKAVDKSNILGFVLIMQERMEILAAELGQLRNLLEKRL